MIVWHLACVAECTEATCLGLEVSATYDVPHAWSLHADETGLVAAGFTDGVSLIGDGEDVWVPLEWAYAAARMGEHTFVADGTRALRVDPEGGTQPVLEAYPGADWVAWVGDSLLFWADGRQLVLTDVIDGVVVPLLQVRAAGENNVLWALRTHAVMGDIAYVGVYPSLVAEDGVPIDWTNPEGTRDVDATGDDILVFRLAGSETGQVGGVSVPGIPAGVALSPDGSRLYVVVDAGGMNTTSWTLVTFALDAPEAPVRLGSSVEQVDGTPLSLAVTEDAAFVGTQQGDLLRFTTESEPRLVSRLATGSEVQALLYLSDGDLVMANWSNGVIRFNLEER